MKPTTVIRSALVAALIAVTALVGAASPSSPAAAKVSPSSCSSGYWSSGGTGTWSFCPWRPTGYNVHKARAKCFNGSRYTYRYGYWTGSNGLSRAYCPAGYTAVGKLILFTY